MNSLIIIVFLGIFYVQAELTQRNSNGSFPNSLNSYSGLIQKKNGFTFFLLKDKDSEDYIYRNISISNSTENKKLPMMPIVIETIPFLKSLTPIYFTMNDTNNLEYIIALDSDKTMWVMKIYNSMLISKFSVNAPYPFTENVLFTTYSLDDCQYIYFCTSFIENKECNIYF